MRFEILSSKVSKPTKEISKTSSTDASILNLPSKSAETPSEVFKFWIVAPGRGKPSLSLIIPEIDCAFNEIEKTKNKNEVNIMCLYIFIFSILNLCLVNYETKICGAHLFRYNLCTTILLQFS